MKIKLDDKHWLNSDRYSYWITALVEPEEDKNGKRKKPYERRVSGYLPTFGQAVESFIDYFVNESQAKSINKLSADIRKLKAEVRGWK